MLYTVKLGYSMPGDEGIVSERRREFVVEADRESHAFDAARRELITQLLVEAADVRPWAVSYERGVGDRRS